MPCFSSQGLRLCLPRLVLLLAAAAHCRSQGQVDWAAVSLTISEPAQGSTVFYHVFDKDPSNVVVRLEFGVVGLRTRADGQFQTTGFGVQLEIDSAGPSPFQAHLAIASSNRVFVSVPKLAWDESDPSRHSVTATLTHDGTAVDSVTDTVTFHLPARVLEEQNGSIRSLPLPSLADFYWTTPHSRPIHKWFHYFDVYHRHVDGVVARVRDMSQLAHLEIGVWAGGSIDMWRYYYGPDATIVGVDIDPEILSHAPPPQVPTRMVVGDQEDCALLSTIAANNGVDGFDVVLDDGGHAMAQQKTSLMVLFKDVRPGGVYIVEDTHTSFIELTYNGSSRDGGGRSTFVGFSRALVRHAVEGCGYDTAQADTDALGFDASGVSGTPCEEAANVGNDHLCRTLAAMHFYSGLVVFSKRPLGFGPAPQWGVLLGIVQRHTGIDVSGPLGVAAMAAASTGSHVFTHTVKDRHSMVVVGVGGDWSPDAWRHALGSSVDVVGAQGDMASFASDCEAARRAHGRASQTGGNHGGQGLHNGQTAAPDPDIVVVHAPALKCDRETLQRVFATMAPDSEAPCDLDTVTALTTDLYCHYLQDDAAAAAARERPEAVLCFWLESLHFYRGHAVLVKRLSEHERERNDYHGYPSQEAGWTYKQRPSGV